MHDTEAKVQEYRDYLSGVFAMFVFSAGLALRSMTDNTCSYFWTVIFVLAFMAYIGLRYGIKGLNEKRKLASWEGIVTKEEHEKIKAARAEIYIVQRLRNKGTYIRL